MKKRKLRSRNTERGLRWECLDCNTLIKGQNDDCICSVSREKRSVK